jgi:HAD superfamily hydrolase (TIGR01509 family)
MTNSHAGVKGVIFDLGSTLIEFESKSWDVLALEGQKRAYDSLIDSDHLLPEFEIFNDRLEAIKNEYRIIATETLKEWRSADAFEKLICELGLENAEERGRICMDAFYDVVREGIVVCQGALETLEAIKGEELKTGLISNTIFPSYAHEVDLDNFGLSPYIDFRLYSCDFGYRKPHPGIYEEGLRRIGLSADETLFVGDRYIEDVKGPMAAGMPAVLKYHEGRDYPDPMPEGFSVVHEISELLKILGVNK